MAFDANGNWVPSSNFNMGNMSQWGQPTQTTGLGLNLQLPQQTGVLADTGFGTNNFDANALTSGNQGGFLSNIGGLQGVASGLGAVGSLAQSWLGFQGLGVARDQLAFQKNAWQEQFNIQKEEYEYQRQRREERMQNYQNSLGNQPNAAQNATV